MAALHAVTVLSRTHLPFARTMAESLREHHRGVHLTAVLVDQLEPPEISSLASPADRTISPLDLGVDRRELHRRALIYDTQGLISSLRPLAVRHVLEDGADAVLLLDADLLALAPLDDLWGLAAEYGVLLSPHTTRALSDQDTIARDENYLRAGTFNGGVLGVGADAGAFLEWMAARTARDCILDRVRGLQYSQTWLNLVPSLFRYHVMLDPGVNVTAHRLAGRDLEGTTERPALDGAPVRLLHFTGFDPAQPGALCCHLPGPQDSLEHRPRMASLCRFYAEQLKRHGWPEEAGRPWSHLACGVAVDNAVRAAYREALLAAEQGSGDEPPDPFEPAEAERFARWLAEQRSEPTQTGDGAAANDETRRLRLRRALRRPAGRL